MATEEPGPKPSPWCSQMFQVGAVVEVIEVAEVVLVDLEKINLLLHHILQVH